MTTVRSNFGQIFSTCEKNLNFWNFVNIKVVPFGFFFLYLWFFMIGQSEKSKIEIKLEDKKIDGTPCISFYSFNF